MAINQLYSMYSDNNQNSQTLIEIWPFDGQRLFFLETREPNNPTEANWECFCFTYNKPGDNIEDFVLKVCNQLGIDTLEKDYRQVGVMQEMDKLIFIFLLSIKTETSSIISNRNGRNGKWFSVQEIESLHLDRCFMSNQFLHYLRYVRKVVFEEYMRKKPNTINRVVSCHAELQVPKRGLPFSGRRPDGKEYVGTLGEIANAFEVYGDALYAQKTLLPETCNNSLGSGSPLLAKPFPPVARAIHNALQTEVLSQYPFPAGDYRIRMAICDYLHQEGFSKHITPDSIIFTESTTYAFNLVLRLIMQPGDVVLFTAPTYGLFAFAPERYGGESRFLPLEEVDGWLVKPEKLALCIDSINKELKSTWKDRYRPKVVAFFQENPHNPLGKVMGGKEKELVLSIARVCRERQVFLLDDLLYRDLGYDRENMALPAAHFDSEWQNVISFMGLSKAFGLAGIRSGMIIADEVIVRGVRNSIFQEIDSASHINAIALQAAFNTSSEREREYADYFTYTISEYRFRFDLIKAAVNGIASVAEANRKRIVEFVKSTLESDEAEKWLTPIDEVDFVPGTTPESGFFCLLDFSALRGKKIGECVIEDDLSLLKCLFSRYRINFITGKSIGWPKKDSIIARVSFSCESDKIIRVFSYLKKELERLA